MFIVLQMELAIPSSLISNLDIVVRYQNILLIKEICKWKGWDSSELINDLLPQSEKEKKSKRTGLKKSTLVINNESYSNSKDKVKDKNISGIDKEIEIRVRTQWMFNHITYYVESPHNNVYRETRYVGRKVANTIDGDFPEL